MKAIFDAVKWFFKKALFLPSWIIFKAWFLFLMVCIVPVFLLVCMLFIIAWLFYSLYDLFFNFFTWCSK